MPLLYLSLSLAVLLFLMIKLRLNAFFSLLIAAIISGVLNGMAPLATLHSMTEGIGQTLSSLVLILVFGAMLGKILEESGAANQITHTISRSFGLKNLPLAILLSGFIVGLPMMYNASFLVLIPIAYSFHHVTKIPLMQIGIPLSASLSVAHAFLPPHPAPVVVAGMYGADINVIFIYGLLISLPALAVAGLVFPRFHRNVVATPPPRLFNGDKALAGPVPGFSLSLVSAIVPFILICLGAIAGSRSSVIAFIGSPEIALFIAVIWAMYFLQVRRGVSVEASMNSMTTAVASIAMIILIIAAGGAFKEVINDSGIATYIKGITAGIALNPLIMSWLLAALIRLAIGSATVATITAAGIMAPIVEVSTVSRELLVLATGSGSLMFSHFNDIGFWMFKEYFNISIKETFLIWTVMESIIGIIGLIGCLILNSIL